MCQTTWRFITELQICLYPGSAISWCGCSSFNNTRNHIPWWKCVSKNGTHFHQYIWSVFCIWTRFWVSSSYSYSPVRIKKPFYISWNFSTWTKLIYNQNLQTNKNSIQENRNVALRNSHSHNVSNMVVIQYCHKFVYFSYCQITFLLLSLTPIQNS